MKDLIDEKNKKAALKRSIVKAWNVNYIDAETLRLQKEAERMQRAADVMDRLDAEKAADQALIQAEIDAAYEEAARREQEAYNATTGSYSGTYGRGQVDDVTKGQIDMILHEKDAMIRDLIDGEK